MHGFVDTMAQYGSYGWWGGEASAPRGMGGMTNQFAAMPSLHVGWALWCGVMLWRSRRHAAGEVAAVAYPLIITFVVMGTANHYLLDAVAGVAVMGVGLLLSTARCCGSRRALRVPLRGPPLPPPGAPIVSGGCETSAGERFPGQRTSSSTPAEAVDGTPSTAR